MTCWLCGPKTNPNANTPSCKNGPCKICKAVANLDEEINQAVAALQRLIAKRYDLLSEQNRTHDLMHRLPVEIKNYTFQLTLPTQDEWGAVARAEWVGKIVMPSFLASICRHWRDIARSDPFLWSTIRITLRKRASTADPSKFVQDWILRSLNLPLTFHIVVRKGLEKEWKRVLEVVSASSDRWHSLSLDMAAGILRASHANNDLQYDRLMKLHIRSSEGFITAPVPSLNSTMSPEEIDVSGLSFRALQISWNNLTSARVERLDLEDITRLFQHASRMIYCHISTLFLEDSNLPMTPLMHQALKVLSLDIVDLDAAAMLLGSLTLPYLQEFHTDDIYYLTPTYLPALVHRSSCPLIRIALSEEYDTEIFLTLQPLPGVTDLILEDVDEIDQFERLLIDGDYFPDLRCLTLRLDPFLHLWDNAIISTLLDCKRPRPDAPEEGGLRKILVLDKDLAQDFDDMWKSDVGKELKELNVILREDGFEILL